MALETSSLPLQKLLLQELLRVPNFLYSGKVKGTAYRVVGLGALLSAALETRSLPLQELLL